MEKNSFFKTKAGGLTIAFIVIMIAFAIIVTGLGAESDAACLVGFLIIAVAMLYSPVRTHIFGKGEKNSGH